MFLLIPNSYRERFICQLIRKLLDEAQINFISCRTRFCFYSRVIIEPRNKERNQS